MKILQICSKIPFPPSDGGSIAMDILTHGLINAGNQVDVLAINTPKHFVNIDNVDIEYRKKTNYKVIFINTDIKPLDAFLNLFSNKSYNVVRFYSKTFEKELLKQLNQNHYDVIQLETLWATPYVDFIRKNCKAKIVLRSQNVEHQIWSKLADDVFNPFKKWYLKLLSKRLKTYEYEILNKFDAIVPITETDATTYKKMGCSTPIKTITFGIDLNKYKIDAANIEKPSVFHIGAMDWRPNVDAIYWFLENIWKKISEKHPSVKLYLAGRKMPDQMLNLTIKNVEIVGEVADSHKFINSKSIMVVPISSGGGIRVKIIEGMSFAKTIISTKLGAEGIEYENNKNIIIADNADEFIEAISKCISNQQFSDTLGVNARKLCEEKYDNQLICNNLSDFYKGLIQS